MQIEDVLFNKSNLATENLINVSKKYSGNVERKKLLMSGENNP